MGKHRYYRAGRNGASRRSRGGQALVEFALSILFLFTLLGGLFQYSLLFNAVNTLTTIARDGARYAAKHGTESNTNYNGTMMNTDTAIRTYTRAVAVSTQNFPSNAFPDSAIAISPLLGTAERTSGGSIQVAVTYNLRRKLFLSSSVPGLAGIGNYTARTIMIIE